MHSHIQRRRRVARGRAIVGAVLLTVVLATLGLHPESTAPTARAAVAASDDPVVPAVPVPAIPVVPAVPTATNVSDVRTERPIQPPPLQAASLPRSAPLRLSVPAIGVNTGLMELGLTVNGKLEVPPAGFPAGWFTGGSTPGEVGPAVIAGHVDWGGQPGVFYDLRNLTPGDEVAVERADGSTAVFRVTQVEHFPKDAFPTDLVYGDIPFAGLRLITCGGAFNAQSGHYVDNVVAFAELVRFT
ncbi:MAG: class F sortase [Actinomycetota bacterium]|nr:class F sortase [Actinomycetota bacterium]